MLVNMTVLIILQNGAFNVKHCKQKLQRMALQTEVGAVYESTHTKPHSVDDVEAEVQYYFDKKFTFSPPKERWPLLPAEKMFTAKQWEIPEMLTMKKELNGMKNQLNDFNLEQWHKHTRSTNPSGNVMWYLKKHIQPEFVTQAWCKFYEVCSSYPVVPKAALQEGVLNTVHLCEAPGAFIAALNHFLKLNHPDLKWEWIATTLNPHYEENQLSLMITDDRFMLLTLDRWKFGPDHTGNIMDLENLKAMVKESTKLGPVLLVTADGSIDCQYQPAEQEELVAPLLFCEVIAALHILSAGGTLVVKAFTMYEHPTICLMYFLNACFETVHVYKPVTSKEGNSECYVVCINYDGTDERKAWLRQLRAHYGVLPNSAMFPLLRIPEIFVEQLLRCAELFKNYQEEVLERNIVLFTIGHSPSLKRIKVLRHRLAEVFIEKYHLRTLKTEKEEVVGKTRLAKVIPLQMDPRNDDGTFNERRRRELLPPAEKLGFMLDDLARFPANWIGGVIKWLEFPQRSFRFKILKGKPISTIRTSKFCSGNLLCLRHQVYSLIQQIEGEKSDGDWKGCSSRLSPPVKKAISDTCPDIFKEQCQVLNFKDFLWSSVLGGRNHEFELKANLLIFESLENAWRDMNLIIEGFPMLTQLSAGFIFMLAHLFDQVGFIRPQGSACAIIFRRFRSRDRAMGVFMEQLKLEAGAGSHETVLSLIPINELVENNEFYETIVTTNTLVLKKQLSNKIEAVVNPPAQS